MTGNDEIERKQCNGRKLMTFEEFCDALKETGAYQAEDGHIYRKDGRILSRQGRNGYYTLRKMFDNHTYYFMEHRVAYYFAHGKFDESLQINHKDFDRSNYSIDNLEWCTHRNNVLYSRKADRYPSLYGEANPNYGNRKLSQYYSQNKDVAKVKQGRPMGQNGRAKKCMLLCLNTGITIEFSCQREAYKFLVDNNTITPQKYPETYIKKLRKEQGYRGYKIIIE